MPPTMPLPSDRNNAYAFNLVFDFIHSFRMPTFFVLAGFFAMLLAEKRGLRGMSLDRMRRVLAPLAAAIVVILPITGLLMIDFMLDARFGTHAIGIGVEKRLARLNHAIGVAGVVAVVIRLGLATDRCAMVPMWITLGGANVFNAIGCTTKRLNTRALHIAKCSPSVRTTQVEIADGDIAVSKGEF